MAKPEAKFDLSKVRNIGIIAHIDAGKTTTTEHILYYAGAIHRLGGVDEGNTETDWMELEREKGITIQSACVPLRWHDCTINLIDTPGHVDFTAEVERSLRVLDGCVVVFDAQKGVEAQSETVWRQADKYRVPRLVFMNKMDIVGADFDNAVLDVRERLAARPVPVVIPIGAGGVKDSPRPFAGVIDLVTMEACYFDHTTPSRPDGKIVRREPIPADLLETAQQWRESLIDVLTEADDEDRITTAYLEGRPLAPETLRDLIRRRTLRLDIQPVLCGSGRNHIGVQLLMDAVCWYLPSPLDRPPVVGRHPVKGTEEVRKPDPKEPFAALVFKIQSDPHGELYYLRVYSGMMKANSRVLNPGRNVKEFLTKLYHVHADPKNKDPVEVAVAGDIVAAIGPKESITGDTLTDAQHPVVLESIQFAEAVVSRSIEPESSADKDRLIEVLNRIRREDPTFTWKVDPETGQTVMSGMGMLHLEVKQYRMEHDFHLKVRVGRPRVSYRETLKRPVRVEGECVKPAGGAGTGLFAKVTVEFEPLPNEPGNVVEHRLDTSVVPPEFLVAAEQGIRGALQSGNFGYPVIHVKATITELQLDPQLSNDIAFQAAGADAVNRALRDNVVLLEPLMHLEVTVPEEYLGPVSADLNARRADIQQMLVRGKLRVLEALVPLAKMFDYSDKIRSLTQGRASWTMEPKTYAPASEETMRSILGEDLAD
ncbi:MAG: elongation factor G [Gemmataceae bacterium]|nr:elongation factor G [Gemmataceae bacterium]MDW8263850.1 elongation factor G [Gemmataceae bacterium]